MKIVIIDHEPYSQMREDYFFINEFIENGFDVEFWSVWKVLKYSKDVEYNYRLEKDNVHYISSEKEFISKLSSLDHSKTFLFIEFWFNKDTYHFFEILYNKRIKWGRLDYFLNPVNNLLEVERESTKDGKLYNKFGYLAKAFLKPKEYRFNYLQLFKQKYLIQLNTSDLIFMTGSNRRGLHPSKQYVSIDYFDIVKFNKELTNFKLLDYPYIVFADVYLGYHPDFQIGNTGEYMNVQLYLDKLNSFFDKLECIFQMPVVIAAHPKSSYTNEFNNRLCIKNASANLIMNSRLLLQHNSLSVTYAMLGNVPIMPFYTSEFVENKVLKNIYRDLWNLSDEIKIVPINIDNINEVDLKEYLKENSTYAEVLKKFFRKDPSENRSNFTIICNNIKNSLKS
ncbi:hypothetical protein ACV0BM_005390 [Elizabethkingia meningoseptica]